MEFTGNLRSLFAQEDLKWLLSLVIRSSSILESCQNNLSSFIFPRYVVPQFTLFIAFVCVCVQIAEVVPDEEALP